MLIPSNNSFQANFQEFNSFQLKLLELLLYLTVNGENFGKLARETHKILVYGAAFLSVWKS